MTLAINGETFPIDAGFERLIDGVQEVIAVGLQVKCDQIRTLGQLYV